MRTAARGAVLLLLLLLLLLLACRKETPARMDGGGTVAHKANPRDPAAREERRDVPRLLILGDGFDDGAETDEFNKIVDRMREDLKSLPGAAADGSSIEVRSDHLPRVDGLPQLAVFHADRESDCYFELKPNAVEDAQQQRVRGFDAQRFLVVVNDTGGGAGGCSYGDVMFVVKDVSFDTLAHELGHGLAGLYDERGLKADDPPPAIDARNCSSKPAPDTPWKDVFSGSDRKCNHYAKLFRPSSQCKMQTPGIATFCSVCEQQLRCVMEQGRLGGCVTGLVLPFPPALLQGRDRVTEVTAAVTGDRIAIMSKREVAVDDLQPHVVRGETFVVVYDVSDPNDKRLVGIGSLPIDAQRVAGETKFFARAYGRNEQGLLEDTIVEVPTGAVRLTLVGIPPDNIAAENLRLEFKYYEQARSAFILNNFIVNEVRKLGFEGTNATSLSLR